MHYNIETRPLESSGTHSARQPVSKQVPGAPHQPAPGQQETAQVFEIRALTGGRPNIITIPRPQPPPSPRPRPRPGPVAPGPPPGVPTPPPTPRRPAHGRLAALAGDTCGGGGGCGNTMGPSAVVFPRPQPPPSPRPRPRPGPVAPGPPPGVPTPPPTPRRPAGAGPPVQGGGSMSAWGRGLSIFLWG